MTIELLIFSDHNKVHFFQPGKQHHILNKVTQEISMVDQIATFATKLKLKHYDIRREIYRATKAEAIFMILQVVNREQDSYINKCNGDIKGQF